MSDWSTLARMAVLGVLAVLATSAPRDAAAQTPACDTIAGTNPIIYGAGGSAQRPLIGRAAHVVQGGTNPVFVVYKDDAGACFGIDALTGFGPTTISGSARYWEAGTGAEKTCTLPLAGEAVDFASMGNSPLLCPLITDPSDYADITDVLGPVSTVNVLVPTASTQQVISAEAFYLVYGLGPDADIAPWNNDSESYYIRRNPNSYVQQFLALATTLPDNAFFGTDAGTNQNTITLLAGLLTPEDGIGFASGEVADANRGAVRTIAWQHVGQNVGYWPDSTATAFDKLGVRTGRYFLWGPGHFYGLQGTAEGSFADPNVAVFLDYLSGRAQPAGTTTTITSVAIANRNVPACAMYVSRDGDLGPMYWDPPEEPCHCAFEFGATGATECDTCDASNPCSGTDVCRNGYCEEY